MNEYTIDQIISQQEDKASATKASFEVTVTSEMMDRFYEISGDNNPLHMDANFARERGFADRVVYGMLTSSFYSTLAGVYLPGKYCLLHSVDSSFHAPVFVGDKLTVSGVVKIKYETTKTIEIAAKIVNQDGKKVGKAKILAGFLK
jgi:acyl dehydratase